jgi:hypothetical protein
MKLAADYNRNPLAVFVVIRTDLNKLYRETEEQFVRVEAVERITYK